MRNGKWKAVTRHEPCPACGKADWCAWADAKRLRCMRGGDAPAGMTFIGDDQGGGRLFESSESSSRPSRQRETRIANPPQNGAVPNFDALAKRFLAALSAEPKAELATALGVTAESLDPLSAGWATADDLRALKASGAGWVENPPDGAFAFPERDGAGRLIGFSFRTRDGRKGGPSGAVGAKRGLVVPATIHKRQGLALVVEGASDVASCGVLGLDAIGRPNNRSGAEDVAKLIKKRDVLVIGENDAKESGAWPGRDGAEHVATRLATIRREPVKWALPPDGVKDIRAWLQARVAAGLQLNDADACAAAGRELLALLQAEADQAEPEKGASVSEQVVRLAQEKYRLGRTEKDEPFAVAHDGPNVAMMLKGSGDALRCKLARDYRATSGRTPGSSALGDAMNVLTGIARDCPAEPVYLRLASYDGGVVLDLADDEGRAVIVRSNGWEVLDRSPVLFRRTALSGALPVPERGGMLADLRALLNVTDDSWPLIAGWLVAALLPDIPHAVLLLSGLQGTGKSCAARTLVLLVDPSAAPLRSEPRDLEQWQVAASGSWAVAIDNLSFISGWLSDAICKAATGDGLVKRKLYSDGDLAVLAFRRVVIITSIDAGALRGDLGDRLLFGDLEPIPEDARLTEQEIDAHFRESQPRLFGALLGALAAVLGKLPDVRPDRLPRMADFGRVLAAADAAGVTDGALDRFLAQQGRISAEVIDADEFGTAVVDLIRAEESWEGTASELLKRLLPDDAKHIPKGWPKSNGVRGRLKRLTPALGTQGIVVDSDRDKTPKRRRMIYLAVGKPAERTVQDVQGVQNETATAQNPDDLDDLDNESPMASGGDGCDTDPSADAAEWLDV